MGDASGSDDATSDGDTETPDLERRMDMMAQVLDKVLDRLDALPAAPRRATSHTSSTTVESLAELAGITLTDVSTMPPREEALMKIMQLKALFPTLGVTPPATTSPLHALGRMLESLLTAALVAPDGSLRPMLDHILVQYFVFIARCGSAEGGDHAALMLSRADIPSDDTDIPALVAQIKEKQRTCHKKTATGKQTDPRATASQGNKNREIKRLRAQVQSLRKGNGKGATKTKTKDRPKAAPLTDEEDEE